VVEGIDDVILAENRPVERADHTHLRQADRFDTHRRAAIRRGRSRNVLQLGHRAVLSVRAGT
jgi:hypothetical protein